MSKILAAVSVMAVLASVSFGQARPSASASRISKTAVSFNVGMVPLGLSEEDETNFLGTFTLRADFRASKGVTFAPEIGVWTNFGGIMVAPGLSFNGWLGNFNFGAGFNFFWAGEGGAFVPKLQAGYKIGRVVLNVYYQTLFEGRGIWSGSVGYVF